MYKTAIAATLVASASATTNVTATVSSCDPSALITKHEGSRTCSYTDTTGHKTVGVGFNMDAVSSSKWASICSSCPDYNSVYSGAKCLSSQNINTLLQYSLRDAKAEAARVVSNYGSMCCNVQNVVTDMTFNLGSLSGFPTLVSLFEKDDWAGAASDMKGTLWCRQVGSRCSEDASMVAGGCGGPGPAPGPSPSGGCKSCIEGGGGAGCASKCAVCGSTCINCVKGGGGKACASKCCDSAAAAPASEHLLGACQSDMSRLESKAQGDSAGRTPDGRCYSHVADYIDAEGYGGIAKGGFDSAIPSSYWSEAHQFADYLNSNGNAARLSLQNTGGTNPYDAPAGSIIVVRAGTPGTHNPTAGDIAVKGSGDHFYNGGEMGYGGSGNFPSGNNFVLGIYVPTKCSGSGPAPGPAPGPSPSGGCKSCIEGGGGAGCASKCAVCGSTCINCVKGGGGKACANKCCDSAAAAPASEHFLEAKKAALAAGYKALRGAARVPSFVKDPTNDCSDKGTCGNAYQACCIAFQIKGYPCGCHLADGTGKVGANCGDCGSAFGVCCLAETCKCDIA